MNLFELFATIGLNDSGFNKGIDEAQTKFEKFAKDTQDGMQKLKTGVDSMNKVALGVGAAFGVLGGIGLKYSADMEMYTTNFAVMLGSQEAAVAKVEELKVMAAKTPFEMSDLAQGTQTLLAFNISATESTGILQMLGDVSLGNSQKLETLSRAYGKMSSSGKVSLEDINMMIDSGFNPLLTVAEKTGESMENMYARVSKGQVGVNEITDAFKTATSEGGQFYNGMEESSKTLTGQMSTLKDNVNSALGEIFLPLAKQLSEETLPALNEKLSDFNEKLVEGKYADLISGVVAVVTALGVALVALNLVVLFNDIMNVKKGIEGYTAVTKLGTVAQGIFNAVAALNPFTLMVIAIVAATTALVVFWKTNEGFRNAMKELWADIKKAFNETLDNMKEKIEGYKQIGKDIINNLLSGLKSAWQPVEDWINEKLGPLDDKLKSLGLGGGNTKAQDAGLRPNGRHANGISSVPFDGYVGILHKNERVLTASENKTYNQGGQDTGLLQEMVAELKALRQEVYRQPERQQNLMRMGVV